MQRVFQTVGMSLASVGAAWTIFNQTIYNVDPGCRGVIFDRFRGVLPTVTDEGLH
jgi:prohibitin 1